MTGIDTGPSLSLWSSIVNARGVHMGTHMESLKLIAD